MQYENNYTMNNIIASNKANSYDDLVEKIKSSLKSRLEFAKDMLVRYRLKLDSVPEYRDKAYPCRPWEEIRMWEESIEFYTSAISAHTDALRVFEKNPRKFILNKHGYIPIELS